MKKLTKGFTLIELLVVIAIIGILSSVVLASLNSARQKSRDARRISDAKQLQLALELAFDSNGTYPVGDEADAEAVIVPEFMPVWPVDPISGADMDFVASSTGYVIRAVLEDPDHSVLDSALPAATYTNGAGDSVVCGDADGSYCISN